MQTVSTTRRSIQAIPFDLFLRHLIAGTIDPDTEVVISLDLNTALALYSVSPEDLSAILAIGDDFAEMRVTSETLASFIKDTLMSEGSEETAAFRLLAREALVHHARRR